MALKFPMNSPSIGIALPEVYANIKGFMGDKQNLRFTVNFYANETARQANAKPIEQKIYTIPYQEMSDSWLGGIYTWLKTQPEFIGAVDC